MMHKDAIIDELRQIELDVVENEKRLAELEALLIEMKRLNEDTTRVQAKLDLMRRNQLDRDQSRQRLTFASSSLAANPYRSGWRPSAFTPKSPSVAGTFNHVCACRRCIGRK